MISELEVQRLCKRYNIKYKYFPQTGILILDSGLDEWQIKYEKHKQKPFCLLHKNKYRQTKNFHVQRWLTTLDQAVDCLVNHKGVLKQLHSFPNTYKNNQIRK